MLVNLGLEGLEDTVQELAASSLYAVNADNMTLSSRFIAGILRAAPSLKDVALLTQTEVVKALFSYRDLLEDRDVVTVLHECRQESDSAAAFLQDVTCYLSFGLKRTFSAVVITLPSTGIRSLPVPQLRHSLNTLRTTAQRMGLTVLFITHGYSDPLTAYDEHLLKPFFAGLASLSEDGRGIHFTLRFWHNALSDVLSLHHQLSVNAQGAFYIAPHEDEDTLSFSDRGEIFSAARALASLKDERHFHHFESNTALYAQALKQGSATVVFELTAMEELTELCELIYKLRRHCGRDLKIVVMESLPLLRVSTEYFILRAGGSFIFDARDSAGHIQVMLKALQSLSYTGEIPGNFEDLKTYLALAGSRGALPLSRFVPLLRAALRQSLGTTLSEGVLIELTAQPALTGAEALEEFSPRRHGDIGTAQGQRVIIFMLALHTAHLSEALERVFNVSPQLLFKGYRLFERTPDILDYLENLRAFVRDSLPSDTATTPDEDHTGEVTVSCAQQGEPLKEAAPLTPVPLRLLA